MKKVDETFDVAGGRPRSLSLLQGTLCGLQAVLALLLGTLQLSDGSLWGGLALGYLLLPAGRVVEESGAPDYLSASVESFLHGLQPKSALQWRLNGIEAALKRRSSGEHGVNWR